MLLGLDVSFGKAMEGEHWQARYRAQDTFKDIAKAQIDAWDLDELELKTEPGREMSMMSMIPTQLHVQCFSRLAALHALYSRNKEFKLHLLRKEVGASCHDHEV